MFDKEFIDELADAIASRVRVAVAQGPRLMTIKQTAEYIGRSPDAVEMLIRRGVIPATKIDGRVQVDRAALDKLIEKRTHFEA